MATVQQRFMFAWQLMGPAHSSRGNNSTYLLGKARQIPTVTAGGQPDQGVLGQFGGCKVGPTGG